MSAAIGQGRKEAGVVPGSVRDERSGRDSGDGHRYLPGKLRRGTGSLSRCEERDMPGHHHWLGRCRDRAVMTGSEDDATLALGGISDRDFRVRGRAHGEGRGEADAG